MSWNAMQQLAAMAGAVRTVTGYAVLVQLCDQYDDNMELVSPSHERLIAQTGRSRPSVIRALRHLEDLGLVVTARGVGRGNRSSYRLPVVEAALKGITADTNPQEKVSNATPIPQEKVSSLNGKGITADRPPIQDSSLVPGELINPGLRQGARDAHAREAVSQNFSPVREYPDTPIGRLTRFAFTAWPPELETFPNAEAELRSDLEKLLVKCKDDDDDAITALQAFSTGMEDGLRPDFRTVGGNVGKWRLANRPTTFNPTRKEHTNGRGFSVHQGPAGPSAATKQLSIDMERRYQEHLAQQSAVRLPEGGAA